MWKVLSGKAGVYAPSINKTRVLTQTVVSSKWSCRWGAIIYLRRAS